MRYILNLHLEEEINKKIKLHVMKVPFFDSERNHLRVIQKRAFLK